MHQLPPCLNMVTAGTRVLLWRPVWVWLSREDPSTHPYSHDPRIDVEELKLLYKLAEGHANMDEQGIHPTLPYYH